MSREKFATVVSHVAFVVGLAGVALGDIVGNLDRLAGVGAGLAIGAVPFVILSRVRRSNRITEAEKDALRREGYRLALDHAARGLLIPPPVHNDGPGATIHELHVASRQRAAG
ncbi:hypothetical protein ACFU7T_25610 [Streptomyces sp. NPDC057555]|uniref:hypothetical protein n=1 Tax=Streptomyces sp. NPDC057555 TaxID=3346166 RepID=UPI003677C052